jgi:hypothetical protein
MPTLEREMTTMDILVIAGLVLMLGILAALALPRIVCPWREHATLRSFADLVDLHHQPNRVLGIPRSGRAAGTYRGRACTIETFKEMGVDPRRRVVLSVDNPLSCSFDVIRKPAWGATAEGRSETSFEVIHSAPPNLAWTVIDAGQLDERSLQFPRQVQANGYHLSLSGCLLRLEHQPRGMCFGRVDREATRLQVLLSALCDAAEAIERTESAHTKSVRAQASVT